MTKSKKFRDLLNPGLIGAVPTRNRMLKMAAHPGFFPYEDGNVQQKAIDYYEAIAKGGIGLIAVGGAPIGAPPGMGYRIDEDRFLPSMTRLAEAVRKYDCPVFIQLFHLGPMLPIMSGEVRPVAASALSKNELPHQNVSPPFEVSLSEIRDIIERFTSDAERAKRAGFQGIELNAGCNHFLNSFLSLAWNKRNDEYGGSLGNRARIIVEIIREIKKCNGQDFAVVILYNVAEPGIKDGINRKESLEFAKIFEAAGADAIHARIEFYTNRKDTGGNESTHFPDVAFYPEPPVYATPDIVDARHYGAGGWVPLAIEIKKVVKIPVISVGRLDPEIGQKLIKRGAVDFININRRIMADHELPKKVIEERFEDINDCTACMTCFNNVEQGLPPKCRVNASLGKEREYEIKPTLSKKKVVVIGGGPAGMEAARVAALRGHNVILLEKEPMLGGSMNLAAVIKGSDRENLLGIVNYLKIQIAKAGVQVRLNKEVTEEVIKDIKPDIVIVARGGSHNIPDLPGIDNKNVLTSQNLHSQLRTYLKLTGTRLMTRIIQKYIPVGKRLVIIGGNIHGCQIAEFLVKRGRKVTIVESSNRIGDGLLPHLIRPQLLDWLNKKNVAIMHSVKIESINDDSIVINVEDNEKRIVEADTIVTALPLLPNTELANNLKDITPEVYAIGDCNAPGLIVDAIADGSRISRII